MIRIRFCGAYVATIASVNKLEAELEATIVFDDPVIGIAKSIDPLNCWLRAYPSLEILTTNVNLKQIEPRTIFASKHSSWVNELHGFSGRTTRAQPRRAGGVARECGNASAIRRWLQRLVRRLVM
jgi:hypothetical protein